MVLIRQAFDVLFQILEFLIIARVILSWLPLGNNPITNFVYMLTEPILGPIREILRKSPLGGPGMMLDFSPIIAFMLIGMIKSILLSIF